jgi:hypothetical protein
VLGSRSLAHSHVLTPPSPLTPQPLTLTRTHVLTPHPQPTLTPHPPHGPQSLVLDLDHTLLNSVTYNELDEEQGKLLEAWHAHERQPGSGADGPLTEAQGAAAGSDATAPAARSAADADAAVSSGGGADGALLHHLRHIRMWTKLRPYVYEFLAAASELYELYVYTMGAKAYAAEMVRLLDPAGTLGLSQSDRVIGKEDSTASHTKDLDVILGSEVRSADECERTGEGC